MTLRKFLAATLLVASTTIAVPAATANAGCTWPCWHRPATATADANPFYHGG